MLSKVVPSALCKAGFGSAAKKPAVGKKAQGFTQTKGGHTPIKK